MDRVDALKELLAKVEAGGDINYRDPLDLVRVWRSPLEYFRITDLITDAYNGSLDAAKALHEAVLGSDWEYGYDGAIAWVKQRGLRTSYRHNGNGYTSRAWLIAILKALIAPEESP